MRPGRRGGPLERQRQRRLGRARAAARHRAVQRRQRVGRRAPRRGGRRRRAPARPAPAPASGSSGQAFVRPAAPGAGLSGPAQVSSAQRRASARSSGASVGCRALLVPVTTLPGRSASSGATCASARIRRRTPRNTEVRTRTPIAAPMRNKIARPYLVDSTVSEVMRERQRLPSTLVRLSWMAVGPIGAELTGSRTVAGCCGGMIDQALEVADGQLGGPVRHVDHAGVHPDLDGVMRAVLDGHRDQPGGAAHRHLLAAMILIWLLRRS